MMITRYYQNLEKYLKAQRVLVIYGPRRIGKTTLLENFLDKTDLKYKLDSGDNMRTQQILSSQDFDQILNYIRGYELIVIDEAQHISNISMGLKIIVDQSPNTKVITTGSSSFELSNQIGEPLTGRKITLTLYSIAQIELLDKYNRFELKEHLEEYLIFGSYPQVITANNKNEKISYLNEIINSYLLKDILAFDNVKGSKVLFDLLKLLAFQVGNLVSLTELATQLKINVRTVERYLDLLEKNFIILRLGGFSRNLRKEIVKKNKYYFWDNGIRNAIISQFNPLDLRNDHGALWENFLVIERMKKRAYKNIYCNNYYWRTHSGQEIDLVEERDGKLFTYEFKWSELDKKIILPSDWQKNYSNSTYEVITPKNYLDFIT